LYVEKRYDLGLQLEGEKNKRLTGQTGICGEKLFLGGGADDHEGGNKAREEVREVKYPIRGLECPKLGPRGGWCETTARVGGGGKTHILFWVNEEEVSAPDMERPFCKGGNPSAYSAKTNTKHNG